MAAFALLVLGVVEEKPDKTAFYVAGGLLVAFALILSFVGLRTEGFPSSKGARTGVCAVAALLVAGAMASAVLTG